MIKYKFQSPILAQGAKQRLWCRSATAILMSIVAMVVCAATWCAAAMAVPGEGPGLELAVNHYPTNLSPGSKGTISVKVFNVGAARTSGPITIVDTLPAGVTATQAGELVSQENPSEPVIVEERWDCTGNGPGGPPGVLEATVVTCTNDPSSLEFLEAGGGAPNVEGPIHEPSVGIAVTVSPSAAEVPETNDVTIAGGGAPVGASVSDPIAISSTPAGFGFASWDGWFSNRDGTIDTQAGSHPYEMTLSFAFSSFINSKGTIQPSGGEVRNITVDLPPGFFGNPSGIPQCTREQLNGLKCPNASQIGVLTVSLSGLGPLRERVYNMVPPPGIAAEFAATVNGINTYLDSGVRTGSDYGVTTRANNTPQRQLVDAVLTLWGVPTDPSHDPWRTGKAGGCNQEEIEENARNRCGALAGAPEFQPTPPFLTLPTLCGESPTFTIRANTWQNSNTAEAHFKLHDTNGNMVGLTGCESLGFAPTIFFSPEASQTDSPSGLTVEVKPSLGGLTDPHGVSASDIQDTTVTLPGGFVVNPGQAAGLQACQDSEAGLGTEAAPSCKLPTKLGTVNIQSPLIEGDPEKEMVGDVYLLQSNPPNLRLLVAASGNGVNVKLVGIASLCENMGQVIDGKACEAQGQLITRFEGTPQLPFSDFKLTFKGGVQAALDTPTQCGIYTANADFTSWSSPFVPDFLSSSGSALTSGPSGGPCPGSPLPFAPTMTAGSTSDHAGAFSPFSLSLQRGDGQQRVEKLQFKEPAGLAGLISQVPFCREPQASLGTCSQASRIGHAIVAAGSGAYPLSIPQPGEPEVSIYLTESYKGAPFGLSIVTPVIVGPFDLGTIVTRARIEVDPSTAQITVTTDPFPQIIDGVPTNIRSIYSVIDRPGFLFNPTNCNEQAFTGTATSVQGAAAGLSSRFGITGCRELSFHPVFTASTQGKTSKADGASLTVKVTAKPGEANIHKVNLQIPLQLPARLSTLQQACTEGQFAANPAGCPAASVIGTAVARTPVLQAPLVGPAYLVSHGGAAFPDVEFVLQANERGGVVKIVLDGGTQIKKGVTFSHFETVPDAPISSFETVLPEGPHSVLATNIPAKANNNLCGQKLTMPTELIGQNNAVIHQTTHLNITGCAKTRTLTRAQKLKLALKACHKKRNHTKRANCERAARKKYGPPNKNRTRK